MANFLTISRLGFLGVCIYLLYLPDATSKWIAFGMVLLIIFIDAIDGTIARKRGEASALGAVLDIAIDRVVENLFWIVYTDLQLIPVLPALIIVTRGILTDAVRGFGLARGTTPFEMMQTSWGKWLVSHRFMRAVSGLTKTLLFMGLSALLAVQTSMPDASWLPAFTTALNLLIVLTVVVNLLRGIPVLIESRRFFDQPHL